MLYVSTSCPSSVVMSAAEEVYQLDAIIDHEAPADVKKTPVKGRPSVETHMHTCTYIGAHNVHIHTCNMHRRIHIMHTHHT